MGREKRRLILQINAYRNTRMKAQQRQWYHWKDEKISYQMV